MRVPHTKLSMASWNGKWKKKIRPDVRVGRFVGRKFVRYWLYYSGPDLNGLDPCVINLAPCLIVVRRLSGNCDLLQSLLDFFSIFNTLN